MQTVNYALSASKIPVFQFTVALHGLRALEFITYAPLSSFQDHFPPPTPKSADLIV